MKFLFVFLFSSFFLSLVGQAAVLKIDLRNPWKKDPFLSEVVKGRSDSIEVGAFERWEKFHIIFENGFTAKVNSKETKVVVDGNHVISISFLPLSSAQPFFDVVEDLIDHMKMLGGTKHDIEKARKEFARRGPSDGGYFPRVKVGTTTVEFRIGSTLRAKGYYFLMTVFPT